MATYSGTSGNDSYTGTSASDTISGNAGNDVLAGGAGNDTIDGGSGNDTLDGGAGSDTAVFRGRYADYTITWDPVARRYRLVDRMAGRDGTDFAWGVESFRFSDGTRTIANLVAGMGDGLQLTGTAGSETLQGDIGYDRLDGLAGNDVLDGRGSDDVLVGGDGNDVLIGGTGNDSLAGDAGSDRAVFTGTFAQYRFSWDHAAGCFVVADQIAGRDGTDTATGIETFQFSDGARSAQQVGTAAGLLAGTEADDAMFAGSGNQALLGLGGKDQLNGGAGDDVLEGGAGDDQLDGGDGAADSAWFQGARSEYDVTWDAVARSYVVADLVPDRDGIDRVRGVESFVFSDGTWTIADLVAGAGDGSVLTGTDANDVLGPGTGYDTLEGGAGSDRLEGGALDDVLAGGDGDDTLVGGTGDDRLDGGGGRNDRAVFQGAYGDYQVTWDAVARQYTFADFVAGRDGTDRLAGIEFFEFADGVRSLAQVLSWGDGESLAGTDGGDHLVGWVGYDTLLGGGGDDHLEGGDASDSLHGGAGNDLLQGGAGSDTLRGGAGDDVVEGGAGHDSVFFQGSIASYQITWDAGSRSYTIRDLVEGRDGTDVVSGAEAFLFQDGSRNVGNLVEGMGDGVEATGSAAADYLSGGVGYDTLRGLDGNDTLDGGGAGDLLQGGSGNDRLTGGAGNDVLQGGADTDTAVYSGVRSGYDITWDAAQRHYVIRDLTANRNGTDFVSGVENFSFQDGMRTIATLVAGAGDGDVLTGTTEADTLAGGAGYDLLQGLEGNDQLDGGALDDRLEGGEGDDRLDGGEGQDVLDGGSGDDVLRGNVGNDRIVGGAGRDTAVFWGSRAAYEITWDAVARAYTFRDTRDGWGMETDTVSGVEFFQFADGTLGIADLVPGEGDGEVVVGTEGDDVAVGDVGYDQLYGLGGQDSLYGGSGGDLLDGGSGDDWLYGGTGDDRIEGGAGRDTAVFGNAFANYAISWDAAARQYTVRDNTVPGQASAPYYTTTVNEGTDTVSGVESFAFSDGTRTFADLGLADGDGLVLAGTTGDDTLLGDAGYDRLLGLEGRDRLEGGAADDVLDGGADDDVLVGGMGDDRIEGGAGRDLAVFANAFASYTITWDAAARQYTIRDHTVPGYTSYPYYTYQLNEGTDVASGIELFRFSDGTRSIADLGLADGDGVALAGTSGDDMLAGEAGYDQLLGLEGRDSLDGGDADDFLDGGADDDTLRGGRGDDRIEGGAGRDVAVFANAFANYTITWDAASRQYTIRDNTVPGYVSYPSYTYQVNEGTDVARGVESFSFSDGVRGIADLGLAEGDGAVFDGTAGDDTLVGDAGFDQLSGLDGADLLDGGDANDLLDGGAGDDMLRGGRGDDRIEGGAGSDTVQFANAFASYTITWDAAARHYTVRDNTVLGYSSYPYYTYLVNEGADVVSGVEFFSFSDGTRGLAALGLDEGDGQVLAGTSADETIVGGGGFDRLLGLEGNDILEAGDAGDVLLGGAGDDQLQGGNGDDALDGGTGSADTAVFRGNFWDYAIAWDNVTGHYAIRDLVAGRDGTDDVFGVERFSFADGVRTRNEIVPGSAGSSLLGTNGMDWLQGAAGDDTLRGQGGDDTLDGGVGDDVLDGGQGNDVLRGGSGADTYVLRAEGLDFIPAFVAGEDRIVLAGSAIYGVAPGALDPGAFQAAPHGVPFDESIRVMFNTANGHLLFDPDGWGGADAIELAVLDLPGLVGTPSAADFRIA